MGTIHAWHHLDAPRFFVDPESGDDATAQADNILRPFKTLGFLSETAAFARFAGKPAVVALKCGASFPGILRVFSGEREDRPFVVCSYGSGPRPRIVPATATQNLFTACQSGSSRPYGLQDCHISDIEFCSEFFDPDSIRFDPLAGSRFGSIVPNSDNAVYHRIVFDGCLFRWRGPSFQKFRSIDPTSTGVTLRRCIIMDAYPTVGHCSGLYSSGFPLTVEDSYFLHNGHARDPEIAERSLVMYGKAYGKATLFNHNAYLESERLRFVGNVVWCGSSMGLKLRHDEPTTEDSGLVVEDNLFIDNEFPLGCVGNTNGVPGRCRRPRIANNVSLYDGRSLHTGRKFAWPYLFNGLVDPVVVGNIYAMPAHKTTAFKFANGDCEGGVFAGNYASDLNGGAGLEANLATNGQAMREHSNRLDLKGAFSGINDLAIVPIWEKQRPGVSWDCRATARTMNESIRAEIRRKLGDVL